ncbi:DNA-binding protein [Methylobacterium sp. M6A4_1b]
MIETVPTSETAHPAAAPTPKRSRRTLVVAAVAAPLAFGAIGLSLARNGSAVMTPVEPTAISALKASGAIAAKGDVAEIYGNKFVIQDGTGKALVETGRRGEGGTLVKPGEAVTVQGRFENGFLHAMLITRADGSRILVGPAGGPPPGTLDWARDRVGLGAKPDLPTLTAQVAAAGYSDIRVTGRGPRHLEVAARGGDGRERQLHVGFDGQIRETRVF